MCIKIYWCGMRQRANHFSKKEKVLGQFLTPYPVAEFMVKFSMSLLDRKEKAIDPSCGDGVFLSSLIENDFKEVWGTDVDPNVISLIPEKVKKVAKIELMDALIRQSLFQPTLPENYFDLAVGNPPFSAKYGRIRDHRLSFYKLGKDKKSQAIEVLFLERFIQLVRNEGVVAIIVPESILAKKNEEDVRRFILGYDLLAIVSLPRGIFRSKNETTSKTSILFIKKKVNSGGKILVLEIKNLKDLEEISKNPKRVYEIGKLVEPRVENLSPSFYDTLPEIATKLPIKNLEELIEEIRTGGTEYGVKRKFIEKGIRYISAKVVTPFGLNFRRDEKFVEENSIMDKKFAHVKKGDLLFVRVGVGCSGRACVVVDEDDFGIADDWIYIIRLKDRELMPFYLAIFMQSRYGKTQIDRMKRGVGTVTIPQIELKKLRVPIPNDEFLKEVKNRYLGMVKNLREQKLDLAEREYKELVKMVEKRIYN
ncbi:MAG: N-6 DNA methylase [Archaeoglobaceae archaeon]|nr:N-6 DNA methylase [Archaeoglobaceae archaeon]MDW8127721.1 N-6 DNA methylase [Archaeoglobaceae archaeon]